MKKDEVFLPKLKSTRLLLRSMTFADIEFVYKHFSDPDVCKYLVDAEPVSNEREAKAIIQWASNPQDVSCHRWIIQLRANKELIGTCGFHAWDQQNNKAEIGYDLCRSYWRKGIAFEAVNTMIASGFARMNLNRIEAFVHLENTASYALLKKLGFQLEGIVRDKHLFRGRYYDHYCFSLLKSDLG